MTHSNLSEPAPQTPPTDAGAMSLMDHLKELRIRLTYALIGIGVGLILGSILVFGPFQLIDYIIAAFVPASMLQGNGDEPLSAIGTAETFTSYMTVAIAFGFMVSMPWLVYQLIAFIVPGLTRSERRAVFIALPFITLFFIAGIAFGWFITVPAAIGFLIGFSTSEFIEVKPAISDFLRTITLLLVINGAVFQLPIIIYVLARLGIVTAQQLARYRRYAMVIVTVVAAIITPTGDPINLLLLAIPMYLLFEVGIILARFAPARAPDNTI
ncbi:MAG: twin-arginine translocase subunit TatC [Chloroflexaceae bacterium]|nr:twin-arginine translocase subunit TatC [Chloroflexaceae bacterium]NJO06534.1 twin-arginine translocase subunit TatC [Chloroflexaceae bacterium]